MHYNLCLTSNPYKETLLLPSRNRFALAKVKSELSCQKKKWLPFNIGKKFFQTVFYDGLKQTLIWKFGQYHVCSVVASDSYG